MAAMRRFEGLQMASDTAVDLASSKRVRYRGAVPESRFFNAQTQSGEATSRDRGVIRHCKWVGDKPETDDSQCGKSAERS